MDSKTLVAIISSLAIFSLSTILAICGSKSANFAPVDVKVFANPLSGISPADFSIQVSIYSISPIKNVTIKFEDQEIFRREIKKEEKIQDTNLTEDKYSISITSGGKNVSISFNERITFAGEPARIFSFVASAETEEKGKGEGKTDVIVYSNQPCSVRIYIASPAGAPIELPPFSVQLGADVTDDRCGNFNHLSGTNCKFKFIWDADNKGGEFSQDGETDQPSFNFTYQELGIYTPRLKVIDDGGNLCENQNIEPVYVLRKFEKFTFIPMEISIPKIQTKFLNPTTVIIISKPDYEITEYEVEKDGRLKFQNIITLTSVDISIGDKFLLAGSGSNVKIFPITASGINWNTYNEITRLSEKIDSITFQNKATFFVFFFGKFVFFCPYKPPDFPGDTGCSTFEMPSEFSGTYGLYADEQNNKIYLAHYQRNTLFKISLHSFNIIYDNTAKIWLVDQNSSTNSEIQINNLPQKFLFFKDTDGKIYLLIPTTDFSRGASYRTYIFEVQPCISGNCSPLSKTNINMPEVIRDIPDLEICTLTDTQKSYTLNAFDATLGNNISLCDTGEICLVSSLCLDEVGGTKCRRISYYPFIFSSGNIKRNLKTNCILTETDAKNILSANFDNLIIHSGRFILSSKISRNKLEIIDSESFNVQPSNISGYQTNEGIFISAAGKEGIKFLKFSNDGALEGTTFHLFVKPDAKDIPGLTYDLVIHPEYSVIEHLYDGKTLVAILQRPGCGEDFNVSGIFAYDMQDQQSLKQRKYKIYKRYNDIGIHSISKVDIKKFSGKYIIDLVGSRCQDPIVDIVSFEIDNFVMKERFRLKIQEPTIDILTYSSDLVYLSTATNIIKIQNGQIRTVATGEGGGILEIYQGYIFEFLTQGPYIKIKVFDGELNKIKEQSIYFGIYPLISKVQITKAIDEIFGTGRDIDIAIVALASPTKQMKVSAMIIFHLTDFLNSGEDIEILGISPNFGIATSDVKYFRGSKNLIFFADLFSRGIFASFLR
ncbi:MAG: hypothetical protein N2254_08730 [bacterium]|nr:hypothetical protein [bacterium]